MNSNASNPRINHNTYCMFFLKLANPLRMGIILCLREKERNVSEITKELKVEQSKISHALSTLKNCNIVKSKKSGKQRVYYLNKDTILPMLKLVDTHSSKHCKGNCHFLKK
jgi:DNA-binding transcriptional ArsR family regulator